MADQGLHMFCGLLRQCCSSRFFARGPTPEDNTAFVWKETRWLNCSACDCFLPAKLFSVVRKWKLETTKEAPVFKDQQLGPQTVAYLYSLKRLSFSIRKYSNTVCLLQLVSLRRVLRCSCRTKETIGVGEECRENQEPKTAWAKTLEQRGQGTSAAFSSFKCMSILRSEPCFSRKKIKIAACPTQ
jgi:hypothetical protein